MKKIVRFWSLLWNFGPYLKKKLSRTVNFIKSSIDFSLGVSIDLLYQSILQMGYEVLG